jgi:citrate lyase subunit beta / citryl-CoA lyase
VARFRSVLFAPATRPGVAGALAKAQADCVVVDLEDGVAVNAKAAASALIPDIVRSLRALAPSVAIFVRVNPPETPWHESDIGALVPELDGVVLPKVDRRAALDALAGALERRGLAHLGIMAGLETVAGAMAEPVLLAPPVVACYFGAEDYITDLGGRRTTAGTEVLYARSRVAVTARLAGVAAIDQVVVDFRDAERFTIDAALARDLGYAGKLCVHPLQVALANEAFSPSAEEVERSRRLLAEVAEGARRHLGVIAFEGQMVDEPVIRRARQILDADAER